MNEYKNIVTVLYVEDEDGVRKGFLRTLNRYAKEVYEASNGQEGLELYKIHRPDIVVTDIKMPKMNGIEMSKAIKEIDPNQKIIITTAHSESSYLLEAITLQLSGYILKPVDKNILKDKILELAKQQFIEVEIHKSRSLIQEIANFQNNMLIVYNKSDKMIFTNQMFLKFFHVTDIEDFLSKYDSDCDIITNCQSNGEWTDKFLSYDDDKRVISLRDKSDDIEKMFIVNIKKIESSEHKICTFTEVTKIAKKKDEFEKKAFKDELTQIFNRAKFNMRLADEIIYHQLEQNELSILFFDIDHFKMFNDTYGHQMGDEILFSLASLINNSCRKTDLFARWGGEEFIVLLPNVDLVSAMRIAEAKRVLIENHTFKDGLKVTCSFGVTTIAEGDDQESFLKRVDDALYIAKENGRNRIEMISPKQI